LGATAVTKAGGLNRNRKHRSAQVIDIYTWPTPNGRKIPIFCEETGLPYRLHNVNIGAGEQFKPEFLAISPNNKIPAIVDQEGPNGQPFSLFESGAILIYLAEKTGRFLPPETRYRVIEWTMFQIANVGTMFGQAHHFRSKAPELPYAIKRYTDESARIYRVVEKRLGEVEYLAGDYSIADMSAYVWFRTPGNHGQKREDYPNITRWYTAIDSRPAVERATKAAKLPA
jgi:GST-like protein